MPTSGPETGGYEHHDLLDEYADHVRSFIDPSALRRLKVVADTANGMGGLVVPKAFEGLPVELEILFGELDGTFPNHPADPIQEENLADLKAAVLASGADIGLAFDGDADRVFLVDEQAQPGVGLAHHRAGGPRHAREAPRRHGALQPHLLQDRSRDHRALRRHGRAHPGRATPSSSR